ncbi:hypothetical protein NRF20_11200 [Streptomyces sp. R-74717]|uniref:hypothetical protein n=1 Tax=Streptomyces TaxID=1883 RepID=UPI0037BCD396
MSSSRTTHTRQSSLRPLLLALGVTVVVVVGGIVAFSVLSDKWLSDAAKKDKNCCWEQSATPVGISERIGIRIPQGAVDRRAAFKSNSRYDTGILAFTLPTDEADGYVGRLIDADTRMAPNVAPKPDAYQGDAPFTHLGLPEPETLASNLGRSSVCPEDTETVEGKYLRNCVDVYAHEFEPGSTRIYIRSHIEAGSSGS